MSVPSTKAYQSYVKDLGQIGKQWHNFISDQPNTFQCQSNSKSIKANTQFCTFDNDSDANKYCLEENSCKAVVCVDSLDTNVTTFKRYLNTCYLTRFSPSRNMSFISTVYMKQLVLQTYKYTKYSVDIVESRNEYTCDSAASSLRNGWCSFRNLSDAKNTCMSDSNCYGVLCANYECKLTKNTFIVVDLDPKPSGANDPPSIVNVEVPSNNQTTTNENPGTISTTKIWVIEPVQHTNSTGATSNERTYHSNTVVFIVVFLVLISLGVAMFVILKFRNPATRLKSWEVYKEIESKFKRASHATSSTADLKLIPHNTNGSHRVIEMRSTGTPTSANFDKHISDLNLTPHQSMNSYNYGARLKSINSLNTKSTVSTKSKVQSIKSVTTSVSELDMLAAANEGINRTFTADTELQNEYDNVERVRKENPSLYSKFTTETSWTVDK